MKTVHTQTAPQAIGPYSQAMICQGLLFTSGQIPLDPTTMQLVEGPIEDQTKQVLSNLDAILKESGCTWQDVVKTTVYMTDLADFEAMNSVYQAHLSGATPARSTVQVAALPKGSKIEIELIAERKGPERTFWDVLPKPTP